MNDFFERGKIMEKTGEREIPAVPGTIEGVDIQHIQRYEWARQFTEGKDVYDIACGSGYASLILGASKYTGYDVSAEAIEYANEYYSSDNKRFCVADAQEMSDIIPVADTIVSFETIEHLQEPTKFLSWIKNHCHTFIVSSPIIGSCGMSPFHVREYTSPEFYQMISQYWENIDLYVQDGLDIREHSWDDRGVIMAVCR